MSVLKSLWASIQGDPVFMRKLNGWLTILWIVMIPLSFVTGLINSVAYVSMLSLLALVSGHWSAWQAARVEVKQQAEIEAKEEHPVEERVAQALADHNVEVATPEDDLHAAMERLEAKLDSLSSQAA